eukprot:TRINITY_DN61378_c0_g2_i2.p2 TRINITY_DN61378_c0_g2~~TRINITY_DN61378_c0_g2_i2.p2  ORF type:complete len:460 (+),score=51.82 TRINITY_DN61378_c0_g2_i2:25-1404(+)
MRLLLKRTFLGLGILGTLSAASWNTIRQRRWDVDAISREYIAIGSKRETKDEAGTDLLPEIQELMEKITSSLESAEKLRVLQPLDELGLYRLQWMQAQLRAMAFNLQSDDSKAEADFDSYCAAVFDTHVSPDYYAPGIIKKLHRQLEEALETEGMGLGQGLTTAPVSTGGTLFEKYTKFRSKFTIPEERYETVFRNVMADVDVRAWNHFDLTDCQLQQKYIHDITHGAEAWCEPVKDRKLTSLMTVNTARPITAEKAQQLAAHESTHHFQFVSMQKNVFKQCPEMEVEVSPGPLDMVLEGGAEVAVDLLYPTEERRNHLIRSVLPKMGRNYDEHLNKVDKLLQVDSITTSLWRAIVAVGRDFQNHKIEKETAREQLVNETMRADNSWPNIAFMEQWGAGYLQTYSWGKHLIKTYLEIKAKENGSTVLHEFVEFTKTPQLPSVMHRYVEKKAPAGWTGLP